MVCFSAIRPPWKKKRNLNMLLFFPLLWSMCFRRNLHRNYLKKITSFALLLKQLYLLFLVEKCVGWAVIWLSLTCFHSQGRHEWPPEIRARISPECQGNMAAYLVWPVDNRCWCGEYWCEVKIVIQFYMAIWRNGDNYKSTSLWVDSYGFQD